MRSSVFSWLVAVLLLGCVVFCSLWRDSVMEVRRYSGNQSVLLDTLRTYKFRDSLSAVSIGVLRLKVDELKDYRAQDSRTIRDLKVRLRRVQSVANTATEANYRLQVAASRVRQDSTGVTGRTKWVDYRVQYRTDTVFVDLVVRDTITQVLHRVPRFRFLGINFGTRGVRQEVFSSNPNSRVVAAEYLEICR